MLDEIRRFIMGEDVTVVLLLGMAIGTLLSLTAWASAASRTFRWTCGLAAAAVLVSTAATQPSGWINVIGLVLTVIGLTAAAVAISSRADDDDQAPISWRGGFFAPMRCMPRTVRKQVRRAHYTRTGTLATALGMEIALLCIKARLDRVSIADQLGIPLGRYSNIEDATEPDSCVSVADLEAIAALHDTRIDAIYRAALDRIACDDFPTRDERMIRNFVLALGADTDRYFTDHATPRSPDFADSM